MKTLVLIRGHGPEQRMVYQNLPYYLNSGCDLIGIDGNDSMINCWPDKFKYVCAFGPTQWSLPGGIKLLVEALEWCLEEAEYDNFLATEADSIFVRSVPDSPPVGCGCFIAGYCPPQWDCGNGPFLHPPFWMDRITLKKFVAVGKQLIAGNQFGNETPDVFAGIVCLKANIPIEQLNVYSTNGLDMRVAAKLIEARTAARNGVWHIHGLKRQDHIDFVLGKTDQWPADTIWEAP